jgi:hypothetical protein
LQYHYRQIPPIQLIPNRITQSREHLFSTDYCHFSLEFFEYFPVLEFFFMMFLMFDDVRFDLDVTWCFDVSFF